MEYFSKVATLDEMTDHVYGRQSVLEKGLRPNLFIRELSINVRYLREEIDRCVLKLSEQTSSYFEKFRSNLLGAIEHYRELAEEFISDQRESFRSELDRIGSDLRSLVFPPTAEA